MNKDQEILEYLKGVLSVEQELILEDNMVVFFTTDDGCYSLEKTMVFVVIYGTTYRMDIK